MTGFATQDTNWSTASGNMTVGEYGTTYQRTDEWDFTITRLIG